MTDRPFPPVFATNHPDRGETVAHEVNRLLRGLREQLAQPPTIAIATAYLNAQGFALLAEELEQAPGVRLLIGAEPQQPEERLFSRRRSDRDLLVKAIADHEAGLKDERDLAGFSVERDVAERRLVAWLQMLGADGAPKVEVRRYTKDFLHGKAYIPESDLAGILAGSSNLTFAGLMLNRELNLGYETGSHKRLVRDWFEELWAEADPYDLAAIYEERFRLHDPWIVFMRMLVALYGYPGDDDSAYTPVLRLTGFQRDGVARIRRIIDEWGGVLVADEVGLGKTFLAGELIAEATKRDRQRALVIVPAALKESTWKPFLDTWDLTSARVKVMSFDELRLADEETLKQLDEYALVVIDEAHNLRNAAAQRSELVRRLLSGAYPKQLVLMTATPVNNSLLDLHTLVGYFVKNDAAFASRGIPSLFKYVRDAQAQDPETLSPAHLFALLDEIAVRRTRGFVKRYYAGSTIRTPTGKEVPIEFPSPRVERIDYELDQAGEQLLERMIAALEPWDADDEKWRPGSAPIPDRLTLARYVPSRYAITDDVEAVQVVNAGFLRSGLLKRLESSPRALANTLGVVLGNNEDFLRGFAQGKVLRGKALTAWGEADDETSIDDVLAAFGDDDLEAVGEAHRLLCRGTQGGRRIRHRPPARAARCRRGRCRGARPKAEKLLATLTDIAREAARPSRDGDVSEGDRRKVIVFSTFADTIEDLHRRVIEAVEGAPATSPLAAYRDRVAEAVRGRKQGIDQGGRARILAGFAPFDRRSLDRRWPAGRDGPVRPASDDGRSLGRGKSPAGRAHRELRPPVEPHAIGPAPRADRSNRSRHREVHLGCFFPATHLNDLLRLEETIQRKIAYAAVSIGIGDVIPGQKAKRIEVVLADNRETIERLREERPELFESGGDSAALSGEEYRRRLELALEDGLVRRRIESLPMGSGTGFRSTLATEHGWVFATEVGPEREARMAFVAANQYWGVRRNDQGEAEVDENPLRSLSDADPGDRSTYAELSDPAYAGVFDAWPEARQAIWRSWMRLTDPANLQPDVKGVLRRAADLVRDSRSILSQPERDRVAVALAQRWPLRVSRDVGRILDDSEVSPV